MLELFSVLGVSFVFTLLAIPWFIPRLAKAGIVGKDMNKEGRPSVPEMGGLVIVGGFIVGVLFAIGLSTFHRMSLQMNLPIVLASLSTILIMAVIGLIDDLLLLKQHVKAVLPLFAALPLVAVRAGITHMFLPFIGDVELRFIYPLFLIPLAITGASNATNMLAGFNGLEAGLGAVMCATVGIIAYHFGNSEAVILSFAMLGALLAFLRFNWYPAKILIGDVGTLPIGALVATAVIVGNIEQAGIILIAPFFLELYLKARSGLKAQSWCDMKKGKLFCPKKAEIFGIGRLVMYLYGGVSERKLVLTILGGECVFALIALYSYFGIHIF